MNNDILISYLVSLSWVSALIGGTYYLTAASLYDAKRQIIKNVVARQPNLWRLRTRPIVTLIINKPHSINSLKLTLDSLKSSYRNVETIVVNDNSSRLSRTDMNHLKAKYPGKKIKAIFSSRKLSLSESAKLCLNQSSGQILLLLEDGNILSPNTLRDGVNYMNLKDLNATLAAYRQLPKKNLLGSSVAAEDILLGTPSKKAQLLREQSLGQVNYGIFYRRQLLKSILEKPTSQNLVQKALHVSLLAIKALWLALLAYLVYLATAHDYAMPLALALLAVFVYAGLIISLEETLSIKNKLGALVNLPSILLFIYCREITNGTRELFDKRLFLGTVVLKKQ